MAQSKHLGPAPTEDEDLDIQATMPEEHAIKPTSLLIKFADLIGA